MAALPAPDNPEPAAMVEKILCIVHHEPRDVGLVVQHLAALGVPAEIRQPNAGDPLPDPSEISRAIIFGGAMSSNDDHDPAIKHELAWIESALRAGTPLIGICLGAQMIARTLGAKVQSHNERRWEIGYRNIVPTPDGQELFEDCSTFYQWHQEGFDLPSDAIRLANGGDFPEQAYRYGSNVFGFQFHPEVEREQLLHWHREFGHDMRHPGADTLEKQQTDDTSHRPQIENWLGKFISNWVEHSDTETPIVAEGSMV